MNSADSREQVISIKIRLNPKTDADVVRHIAGFANKTNYIKSLILHDIDPQNAKEKTASDNPSETVFFTLNLYPHEDATIISHLETISNKRDYIAALVRADIAGTESESWNDIMDKTDLNGTLFMLKMLSSNLEDIAGKTKDQAKQGFLLALKSQIEDAVRVINSGLDLG